MKISNLFKKADKSAKNAQISKIDLDQLEKIVGGVSTIELTETQRAAILLNTTKSNTKDY